MHVEAVRVLGVVAGQRRGAVRTEELVLVEHAGEDPAQLGLVEHGEHPPAVDADAAGVVDGGEQVGHGLDPAPEPGQELVADPGLLERQDRRCAQRQQPDHASAP